MEPITPEFVISNLDAVVSKLFYLRGQPVKLAPYQREFISAALTRKHRKIAFVSSTRVGKTTSTSILAVLLALLYGHEDIAIFAPQWPQAELLYRTIREYLMSNPELHEFIDQTRPFRVNEMGLINGSTIRCFSADNETAALGFGATVLIVDEAASVSDETYRTRLIRLLAGTAGRQKPMLILLSTPTSINFFYDSVNNPEFKVFRVGWNEAVKAGIIDKEMIEFAKAKMTDNEFTMWFDAEFVTAGGKLFDSRKVQKLAILKEAPGPIEGYDHFIGLDVARLGDDETALSILRYPHNQSWDEALIEQVALYTRAKHNVADTIGWATSIIDVWRPVRVVVDSIGLGAGVYDLLNEKYEGTEMVQAITNAGNERNDVYTSLSDLVDNEKILLLNSEKLKEQLNGYTVEYTSAGKLKILKAEHAHDDCADATCFAAFGVRTMKEETVYLLDSMMKSKWFGSSSNDMPVFGSRLPTLAPAG